MKTHRSRTSTHQIPTSSEKNTSNGLNVSPPDYGLDFADSKREVIQPMMNGAPVNTPTNSLSSSPNNTGLPDNLKAGVESLSGYSMDDVKVHYNSSKPAKINALAYSQGMDIFIGPGQKKHLPHETWHAAQKKQGRVKTNTSFMGMSGNDDPKLEKEADVMGKKASQYSRTSDTYEVKKSKTGNQVQLFSPVVQRITKVQVEGRRIGISLELLPDEELEALVAYMNNEEGAPDFTIELDSETSDEFRSRTEKKLAARKKVTPHFSVRGRALDIQNGVLFTDDEFIREIGKDFDLGVYPTEYENEVISEYPDLFNELQLLIDQPELGNTKFYGKTELRGPRSITASISSSAVINYPTNKEIYSNITLDGPSVRGDESNTRNKAMGGLSALNYADQVSFPNAQDHSWEWLHLVGSAIGGDNVEGNLVAGTYDMNTLMIPLEQTIVEYSHRPDVTPSNPMKVTAKASLWNNGSNNTYVAESITLKIEHGTKEFFLGPIALEAAKLTKLEFDFYRHIFERMAFS